MARIRDFIGIGTEAGSKLNIWVQILFFINVGSGTVTGLTDSSIAFSGAIDTLIYKGQLGLSISLLDGNPGAQSGPCSLSVNGMTGNGIYRVEGQALVVDANFADGKSISVKISRGGAQDRETYLALSGAYSLNVHLTQA